MKIYVFAFLGTFLCCFFPSIAKGEVPIDSMAYFDQILTNSSLSVPKQIKLANRAIAYAHRHKNIYKEMDFGVKKAFLFFSSSEYQKAITLNAQYIKIIEKYIKKDGLAPWKNLYVDALGNKGLALVYSQQTDSALKTFRSIASIASTDSISLPMAKYYNGMGVVFSHQQFFDIALPYFNKSLSLYEKLENARGCYLVNNNIGSLYLSLGDYKKALPYFTKVQQLIAQEKYKGEELVYSNYSIALSYQGLHNYELAATYFAEAIKISQERQFNHLKYNIQTHYALNLFLRGKYEQAEALAVESLEMAQRKKNYTLQLDALRTLSYIMEAKKDFNRANVYLKDYIKINDFLSQKENQEKLLKQKFEFDNYKTEQKRQLELKNLELANSKIIRRNLWITSLGLLSILLVLGFIWLSKKIQTQRKNNWLIINRLDELKENSKRHLETLEQNFEEQLDGKNKELAANALFLLRLDSIGAEISKKIKQLKVNFSLKGKEKILACEIEQLVEELSSGKKSWGEFQFYFNQVDTDFMQKLSKTYPELSPNEKQLCVLFKLNLSNKDIASLSNKTLQSIGMAKFRLKKKMGLSELQDLAKILQEL
ncbi:MAG: tetratricopeptide repeat protein [Bacteroidales bacterium]